MKLSSKPIASAVPVALVGACSILNRVEVCDVAPPPEFQVNVRAEANQYPTAAQGVTTLSPGLFAAVWTSDDDQDAMVPSEVRAGLFSVNGTRPTACNTDISEVRVSDPTELAVGQPVIAAGPSGSGSVFVAWRSRDAGSSPSTGPFVIRARVLNFQLCAVSPVLTVSDAAFPINGAPSLAVRADGREALAAWLSFGPAGGAVRVRPFGVANLAGGRVEANGCDAMDAPCSLRTGASFGAVSVRAVGAGYVTAWTRSLTAGTYSIEYQRLGAAGQPRAMGTLPETLVDLQTQWLAMTPDDTGWALAWSARTSMNLAEQRDSDIMVRRFNADDSPRGRAFRANDASAGVQGAVALETLGAGRLAVAWTDLATEGRAGEVRAVVLGADDRPLFNVVRCDAGSFLVGTQSRGRRGNPSFARSGNHLVVAMSDSSMTGLDVFGYAVRARSFALDALLGHGP